MTSPQTAPEPSLREVLQELVRLKALKDRLRVGPHEWYAKGETESWTIAHKSYVEGKKIAWANAITALSAHPPLNAPADSPPQSGMPTFDADDPRFREAFEAAAGSMNLDITRKGELYRSTYANWGFRLAYGTVNRLKLYAGPGGRLKAVLDAMSSEAAPQSVQASPPAFRLTALKRLREFVVSRAAATEDWPADEALATVDSLLAAQSVPVAPSVPSAQEPGTS